MSPNEIETEIKIALVEWRDYDRLLRALDPSEAHFTQHNNYLDDASRSLRKADVMLRAREIQFPVGAAKGLGKPPVTVTAKRRKSAIGGVFISEEREGVMDFDDWRDFEIGKAPLDTSGHVFKWVKEQVDHGDLVIVGKTINHRWKIRSSAFMLEIDKTLFPDGSTECEVECETILPDEAKKHIEALLTGLKIPFRDQTEGKYARFLSRI
jgi:uncharacterized protein YjbK